MRVLVCLAMALNIDMIFIDDLFSQLNFYNIFLETSITTHINHVIQANPISRRTNRPQEDG